LFSSEVEVIHLSMEILGNGMGRNGLKSPKLDYHREHRIMASDRGMACLFFVRNLLISEIAWALLTVHHRRSSLSERL
jgi:hypothetical protein